jgi:hypothetical protein
VIAACGFKDKHIKKSLLEFVKRKDLGDVAHGQALIALAQQEYDQNEADQVMSLIVEHIEGDQTKRFDNHVKNAGFRALGKLSYNSSKPYEYLKNRVVSEVGESKRVSLLALADSARNLDEKTQKDAILILVTNLNDKWDKIRLSSATGLAMLKASSDRSTVERIKKTIAFQFHPDFDVLVDRLKRDTNSDVKTLEKKIEEMKKQMDQMQLSLTKVLEKQNK